MERRLPRVPATILLTYGSYVRVLTAEPNLSNTGSTPTTVWFLDAVLEPIEAIEPSGQHPGIPSMLREKSIDQHRPYRGREQLPFDVPVEQLGHA